jgi:hypothetical protein
MSRGEETREAKRKPCAARASHTTQSHRSRRWFARCPYLSGEEELLLLLVLHVPRQLNTHARNRPQHKFALELALARTLGTLVGGKRRLRGSGVGGGGSNGSGVGDDVAAVCAGDGDEERRAGGSVGEGQLQRARAAVRCDTRERRRADCNQPTKSRNR